MTKGGPMSSQELSTVWEDFKSNKEVSWRTIAGSSVLKDKYSKSSSVHFLKHGEETNVTNLFNISH